MTARVNKIMLVAELVVLAIFLVIGVVALAQGKGRGFDFTPLYNADTFSLRPGLRRGVDRRAVLPGLRRHLDARRGEPGGRRRDRPLDGRRARCWPACCSSCRPGSRRCSCRTPTGLIAKGDPGGTAFYDAAGVAGGDWLSMLTAVATAIAWGFANSLVAQAATSRLLFAMARDRQLPSFLAKVHPTKGVPTNATFLVAVVSLVVGLLHGPAATTASRCSARWSTSARSPRSWSCTSRSSCTTSCAAAAATGWRHLVSPGLGFAILAYVIINANVAAQWIGLVWLGARRRRAGRAARHRPPARAHARRLRTRDAGGPVTDVRTLRPTPDQYAYAFGGRDPLLTGGTGHDRRAVHRGLLRRATCAASTTCPARSASSRTSTRSPARSHVEGAEPGDTLAVHFVEIAPARDWAVSSTFPHFGALTTTHTDGDAAPGARGAGVDLRDRPSPPACAASRPAAPTSRVELPLDPMHGTVGVAPAAGEVLHVDHAGRARRQHGHPRAARRRHRRTSRVNVPGGLLSLGDGHCPQGEGEVCGTAVEAAMNTVVVVDLIKGGGPPWPRIESDDVPDDHRLDPAARGRLPDQPARPGRLGRRRCSGSTSSTPTSWSARPGWRRSATSSTPTTRWSPSWPSCCRLGLGVRRRARRACATSGPTTWRTGSRRRPAPATQSRCRRPDARRARRSTAARTDSSVPTTRTSTFARVTAV